MGTKDRMGDGRSPCLLECTKWVVPIRHSIEHTIHSAFILEIHLFISYVCSSPVYLTYYKLFRHLNVSLRTVWGQHFHSP